MLIHHFALLHHARRADGFQDLHFSENPEKVADILFVGAEKARCIANNKLEEVRKKVGLI